MIYTTPATLIHTIQDAVVPRIRIEEGSQQKYTIINLVYVFKTLKQQWRRLVEVATRCWRLQLTETQSFPNLEHSM